MSLHVSVNRFPNMVIGTITRESVHNVSGVLVFGIVLV